MNFGKLILASCTLGPIGFAFGCGAAFLFRFGAPSLFGAGTAALFVLLAMRDVAAGDITDDRAGCDTGLPQDDERDEFNHLQGTGLVGDPDYYSNRHLHDDN